MERAWDDAEVAAIIAAEAARRRQSDRGPMSEPMKVHQPPGELNKRYLGAMVSAVVGHNRRNQEEGCWRQRGLLARVDQMHRPRDGSSEGRGQGPAEVCYKDQSMTADKQKRRRRSSSASPEVTNQVQEASREDWAARKALALQARAAVASIGSTPAPQAAGAVSGGGDNTGLEAPKKAKKTKKKEKKEKKEKKGKCPKKEKKHKKSKKRARSNSDGSSDGSGSNKSGKPCRAAAAGLCGKFSGWDGHAAYVD